MEFKKIVGVVICLVILGGSFGFSQIQRSNADAKFNSLRSEKAHIENQIKLKELSVKNEVDKVLESVTGLNNEKFNKDKKVAEEFMRKVFTWSSYKEYNEVRNEIMKTHNLKADSGFIKTFMPEIVNEKMDGKDYNRIDVFGYNMSFETFTPHVVGINGLDYSYFSIVTVSSRDKEHGGEAFMKAVMTYKIDKDGNISDLMALPTQS